jgi:hypothetical protein
MAPRNGRDLARQAERDSETELATYIPNTEPDDETGDDFRTRQTPQRLQQMKTSGPKELKHPQTGSPQAAVTSFNREHHTELTVKDFYKLLRHAILNRLENLPEDIKVSQVKKREAIEDCPVKGCKGNVRKIISAVLSRTDNPELGKARVKTILLHQLDKHPKRALTSISAREILDILAAPNQEEEKNTGETKKTVKKRKTKKKTSSKKKASPKRKRTKKKK